MCVAITLAPGTNLTLNEVERMNRANADGVGVAWARGGAVQWYKTTKVDPKYITGMIAAWADYPRLVHFRYATAGGTRPDLCHPFEISAVANCAPVGKSDKVMIHNGHWNRWSEVKDLLSKEGLLPDAGPWSDTRLAAYLAHEDPDWLTALGGKVAVMNGEGDIHRLGEWAELRPGVMVSNNGWVTQAEYRRGGYTGYRAWKGWDWSEEEYEAFFKEQEEDQEAELAKLIKEEEEREAASANKKEGKRAKKRRLREGREPPLLTAGTPLNGDAPTAAGRGVVPLEDIGGDTCSLTTAAPAAAAKTYDYAPWQNPDTGKWYKCIKVGGVNQVVETTAPGA